jgi:2-keto-3-deoxy-L-rhamnonate aldolase RhmA
MNAIELKKKWAAGEPSPGMWIRLTDPTVVDLIGDVEFDWVLFDAEHVAFDFQTIQTLFIALKGTPTVPMVRVPWNDFVFIKRILDIGAAGVLVPHIKTADEARAAVAACKYPPLGIRGTGPRRPGRYGRLEQEHIAVANEQTIVMAMIETAEAVQNIDDILAVAGLNAIVFGPVDLATSLGFLGDWQHPQVQQAIETVIDAAKTRRMPFGAGRALDDPTEWLELGAQILIVGDDEWFIRRSAFAALTNFRQALARQAQS